MRSIKLPSWISRALGVGERAAPPQVFAVGENTLAYARFVDADGGRLRLAEFNQVPLPKEVLGSGPLGGPIRDQPELDNIVQGLVSGLEERVTKASLVLPDTWARIVFLETVELPKADHQRDEALRWTLKQQVPFRVEDLRVNSEEVAPLLDQQAPVRMLVGFGMEQVLAGFESSFTKAGVQIGHISNFSMAFADGAIAESDSEALLFGAVDGYSVVVMDRREPVLFRSKRLEAGLDREVLGGMVERELRLTLGFLEKRRPDVGLSRLVVAGQSDPDFWMEAARRGMAQGRGGISDGGPEVVPASIALSERVDWAGRVDAAGQSALSSYLLPMFGAAQRSVA